MSDSELISPGEAAKHFGVTVKTLRGWADKGYLTPIRTMGGHYRYRLTEIEAALAVEQPAKAAS